MPNDDVLSANAASLCHGFKDPTPKSFEVQQQRSGTISTCPYDSPTYIEQMTYSSAACLTDFLFMLLHASKFDVCLFVVSRFLCRFSKSSCLLPITLRLCRFPYVSSKPLSSRLDHFALFVLSVIFCYCLFSFSACAPKELYRRLQPLLRAQ